MSTMDASEHDTLVWRLRQLAATRPDDLALTIVKAEGEHDAELTLSYAQLDTRCRAVAAVLQGRWALGERVLLLMDNDEHYVVGFMACLYAGLVAVPVFPPESLREQHLARLRAIATDAQACGVLSTEAMLPLIQPLLAPGVGLVAVDAASHWPAADWRPHAPREGDLAFLQYTSGSTASPKGVMVSHGNLSANERAIAEGFDVRPDDVVVSWLPLFHDMGLIGGLLQALHAGVPTVLMSPRYFLERPLRWLKAIERHRGTVSGGPDFAYRLCLERITDAQRDALDLSSWRLAFSGAEPIRYDTLEGFVRRFAPAGLRATAVYPCYGLAEATLFVTGSRRDQGMRTATFDAPALAQGRGAAADQGRKLVACGQPVSRHALRIADPGDGRALGDGQIGEVWVSGPSVAQGYWARPEASAEAFVQREGGRWLRTGDLGLCHEGQLYITGRLKDVIIVRGQNLYPQDIERAVEAGVPEVRKGRVAAFAVDGVGGLPGEGIGVAAEVPRKQQGHVSPLALAEAIGRVLGGLCGEPVSVVVLLQPGALPKTSSGKLQRQACRQGWREGLLDAFAVVEHGQLVRGADGASGDAGANALAPVALDDDERALATLWHEVLLRWRPGLPLPDPEAHFFALGGNSLAAAQLAMRMGAQWGREVPPRLLFDHPVLRDCTRALLALPTLAGSQGVQADVPGSGGPVLRPLPAEARARPQPLSHAQQRLWFLWQLELGSTAYHVSGALRLRGGLDMRACRSALNALVAKHESLRTVFRAGSDGEPLQHVQAAASMALAECDLRGVQSAEREARVQAWAQAEQAQPFDLREGPLVRAALARLADDEHVLLLVLHHIVCDGESMQVLVVDLADAYAATLAGTPVPLPTWPALQYADYAVWQRAWLAEGHARSQLAHWRAQLGGEQPVLALPTDHPRGPVAAYRAARLVLALPVELSSALAQQALAQGASVFMLLLTAWQALLYRWTGQHDIRVGVPVANRHHAGTEGVVGFFVNTLVMRARLQGRLSLREALQAVREQALQAQQHQDLPFDQLVEALQPERSLSHTPLCQVTANHLRQDWAQHAALPGLSVEQLDLPEVAAQFELTLETRERPDGTLGAHLVYAAELFEPATIERLGQGWLRLLEALAHRPDQPMGDVALLGPDDHTLLADWGRGDLPVTGADASAGALATLPPARPQWAHQRIEAVARRHPHAVALAMGDTSLSFGELNRRANRLAHRLIGLGVRPEARVGVALDRSIDLVVALLAVLKAGAAYVPLDPDYPRDRLDHMVTDSGIAWVLTQASARARLSLPAGPLLLSLDEEGAQGMLPGTHDENPAVPLHPQHLAYVIYTSGSTGRPKGVAVAHWPLVMHLDAIAQRYDVRPGDRELLFFSMNFDAAVEQWMTPLCGGAALVLAEREQLAIEPFARLIAEQRITTLHLPPAYLRLLAPALQGRDTRVRNCIVGGEAWSEADLADARAALPAQRFVNAYGPTETIITPTAWVGGPMAAEDGPSGLRVQGAVPIGRPVGDRRAWVLDEDLNPVPPGACGELYIGGLGLARAYHARPGLSAERFVADPFDTQGGRLYRTGDRVRWRADGQLDYLGRLDQQVKIRGFRIELGEIESVLRAQPGVAEAAVLARTGPSGPRLVGYAAAREGEVIEAAALKAALSARLPDYMVPGTLVLLSVLPLNPNGKVDRAALPEPAAQPDSAQEAPTGTVASVIAGIWAQALDLPRVGLHDNFFDLGGHSLLLMKVQRQLEQALDARVSVIDLFRCTTVATLAAHLEAQASGDGVAGAEAGLQQHQARARRQRRAFLPRKPTVERTPS